MNDSSATTHKHMVVGALAPGGGTPIVWLYGYIVCATGKSIVFKPLVWYRV